MISKTIHLAALLIVALPVISAEITFNTTLTFPGASEPYYEGAILPSAPLSQACAATWARPVPCSEWFFKSSGHLLKELGQSAADGAPSEEEILSESTLNELCTDQCIEGLRAWRDDLRADCSAEDVKSANSVEYDQKWDGSRWGREVLALFLDKTMFTVETLFFPTCLRDLGSNKFCYLLGSEDPFNGKTWPDRDDTEPTTELAAGFCKSTCMTQKSVFFWDIVSLIYGEYAASVGNAKILCPDLDTSNFPFLASNSPSSTSESASPSPSATSTGNSNSGHMSSSSTGALNQTNSTGVVTPSENAAGSLRMIPLVWEVGSFAVIVVLGLGLL